MVVGFLLNFFAVDRDELAGLDPAAFDDRVRPPGFQLRGLEPHTSFDALSDLLDVGNDEGLRPVDPAGGEQMFFTLDDALVGALASLPDHKVRPLADDWFETATLDGYDEDDAAGLLRDLRPLAIHAHQHDHAVVVWLCL